MTELYLLIFHRSKSLRIYKNHLIESLSDKENTISINTITFYYSPAIKIVWHKTTDV